MLTTQQMYDETKTVTRRLGWWSLKANTEVMAVEKGMGLKQGEKIKRIYPILVLATFPEALSRLLNNDKYAFEEVRREGFPDMTPRQFVEFFCESHKCDPHKVVNRILFCKSSDIIGDSYEK